MNRQPPTARADRRRRPKLDKDHVLGLRELRFMTDLMDHLRRQYPHRNRVVHYDDLLVALLLAFYNPVVRSLRGVEDASQMPGINQHLNIDALRRSTVSDNMALFDPQLLLPLIESISQRLTPRQIDEHDGDLRALLTRLLIFDGSYFRIASDVQWALHQRHGTSGKIKRAQVRLNLHLAARSGLPTGAAGVSVSGHGGGGDARDLPETQAILNDVKQGDIVVADRGCFSHDTVHELLGRKVDFVLRLQSVVKCQVIEQRVVSQECAAAGVISDQIVLLTGMRNEHAPVPLRLVTVRPDEKDSTRDATDSMATPRADAPASSTPDASRAAGASAARSPLRLLTSLTDDCVLPRHVGAIYRRRWDIELFFRWLKTCAGWEHLISHHRNGVLTQFYAALIGTMLLALFSERRPDKYALGLMSLVVAGQGTVAQALAIYQKRAAERERDRQRQAAKRTAKKTQ